MVNFVIDKVNEFTDHAPQFDDMTCVVIQRVLSERISNPLPMEAIVTDQLTFEIANDLGQLPVVLESVDAFFVSGKIGRAGLGGHFVLLYRWHHRGEKCVDGGVLRYESSGGAR